MGEVIRKSCIYDDKSLVTRIYKESQLNDSPPQKKRAKILISHLSKEDI